MPIVPRWLRNEPLESTSTPSVARIAVSDDQPTVYQRNRPGGARPAERDFSITCTLGGFKEVGIPWEGTSYEDARDSFLEFLYNDDEFGIASTEPHKYYRSTYVNFNGKHQLLVFRTTWIDGFTVG